MPEVVIDRLLELADSTSTESRIVANFLLAWWNAETCGGFDVSDLAVVARPTADDMIAVMTLVAASRLSPEALGYQREFDELVAEWRPSLVAPPR